MQSYKTFKLLIADDHKLIIDGLSRILEDEKITSEIHTALNGKEAVDCILKNDIDCVLMDINMPVLNGYEATKIIKEKKPYTKIIIVSMLCDASVITKLLGAGAALWNLYGPTETTIWSTLTRIGAGDGPPLIGRPVANTTHTFSMPTCSRCRWEYTASSISAATAWHEAT